MVSPLIHCQFCPGLLLCTLSPGRHTWTRIGSFESLCGLQLWLPTLRSVNRTPSVPMLLGAAAFAALESDRNHHTLPACPEVEFACIPVARQMPRCSRYFSWEGNHGSSPPDGTVLGPRFRRNHPGAAINLASRHYTGSSRHGPAASSLSFSILSASFFGPFRIPLPNGIPFGILREM
jgi:hypothetical protein